MVATAACLNGFAPYPSSSSPIPSAALVDLASSAQVGRGQFVTISATGYASLNDGTAPNLICAGIGNPEFLSEQPAADGAARTGVWWGFAQGIPASTITSDGFTRADMGVPFWIKDENTPGKKSNHSGSNRPLGGLVFGLGPDGNPILWSGPVAQLLARATLITQSFAHAWYTIADAAANTATTERAIPTAAVHGVITAVEFVGAAVAADNTDYVTITIKRYTSADSYAAGVTVATYDSRAANQGAITAFTPAAFALSGTAANLNRLETDRFTITVAKGGSGKQLIGNVVVNGKAI